MAMLTTQVTNAFMRDTTYQFCEVCMLQGSKTMGLQLIDGKSSSCRPRSQEIYWAVF